MPEIKFERFERDAQFNKERAPRDKINDFRVIIDGEFRALLRRRVWGRGYFLTDIDQRDIERPYPKSYGGGHPIHIESQGLFKVAILAALTEGLIPDAQTLEEIRAVETAKMHAEAAEEDARRREGRMGNAAPRLYDLLKRYHDEGMLRGLGAGLGWRESEVTAILNYIDNGGTPNDTDLD